VNAKLGELAAVVLHTILEKMEVEESSEELSNESKNQKTLILCPQCKKGFPTPSKVKRHLMAVHEKVREFQCDICTHAFSQKIHVLKHRQAVHKSELEANPALLNNQNFRIHSHQPKLQVPNHEFQTCTVTEKPKKRKKKLNVINKSVEQVPTQVVIQQPTILHLNLDLQTLEPTSSSALIGNFNENKPITCQVKLCEDVNLDELDRTNQLALDDKQFDLSKLTQQSSFDNDLEKTLAQLQPIAKEFAAFEDMQNQEKIFQELVPLNDIKPTIFEEVKDGKKAACPCEVCGKTFSSPSKMRRHKRIVHEKIKPFQCSVCNKDFGQKVNLLGHLQSKHKLSEAEAKNGIKTNHVPKVKVENKIKTIIEDSNTNLENNKLVSPALVEANNKKLFKCMECVFDSEDSGDMISHHLSKHVQPMFNFDTSDLTLE